MKQATVLTVFIAVVSVSFGTPVNEVKINNDTLLKSNTAGIQEMLKEILNATGLQSNFELKEANVLNIEASVSHRKRYILYNPAYIRSLTNITRDKWAVMALLAHEIGHHLNGHTIRKGGSTPELELQADEFAGFILYKLGATLQQSQSVMHHIAKAKESKTHPSRDSRLLAIERGWDKASGLGQMKDTAKK